MHMSDEIIFTGLMQEALRRGKSSDQTRREAEFIATLLDLTAPADLLDVPCGEARLALELAARRYRITGVDNAPDMLAYARQMAAARDLSDSFTAEQRDMRDLPWHEQFDGAYCLWESFGYFDDAGNQAFLSAVAGALKPGGCFVFDTHIVESIMPEARHRDWQPIGDDLLVLEDQEYDHVSGTFIRHWIVIKGDRREERSLNIQLYTFRQLVSMVKAAGFETVEDYGWMSLMPYLPGSPRLVLVARKA
jgi:SAM-dependent methyltransferase